MVYGGEKKAKIVGAYRKQDENATRSRTLVAAEIRLN